jgi:DNA-binding FrmR family transcriptional regulator
MDPEQAEGHALEAAGNLHSGVARRDKPDLLQRLSRVEGQVRGIRRMVEEDRYCPEILTQIAAVRAALDRVGLILLENHTRGCIVDTVKAGDPDAAMTELMDIVRKFLP